MAPFPEAEDMTIKRLYVALKRDDMQLLQMGAHKLHEKYHTGYKFELLDDLRQILSYVEEQQIPNDIKELLIKTINDILDNKEPDSYLYDSMQENNTAETPNAVENTEENSFKDDSLQTGLISEEVNKASDDTYLQEILPKQPVVQEIPPIQQVAEYKYDDSNDTFSQDSSSDIAHEPVKEEEPVIFTPKDAVINMVNTINDEPVLSVQNEVQNTQDETVPAFKIIPEKELTLNNVAVFYDDKAPFIDYVKNKSFRLEMDSIALNRAGNPMADAAIVKNTVDIQTDEYSEILKMLNTIKGDVYFVTTSKSENLLKTFVESGINFKIPNVKTKESEGKKIEVIPLFGLSNIFYCPKCGRKEAVVTPENKVLTTQCKECSGVMYPDLYEALNFETNANPYYFILAISAMSHAETWILINPPLENSRTLTSMFLKTAFEASKPKKVYILSKETTKKEYYKQMFKEIDSSIEVKTDFITEDSLCEEFINSEMSTIKVTA